MGNCISISINIPLEQLLTVCCAAQRKTIADLQHDWAMLTAAREDISRTLRERPELIPLEQEKQWLTRVEALVDPVEKLLTDANRTYNWKKLLFVEKIAQMDQEVLDLLDKKPSLIVERPHVAPALQMPTEPTTGMQVMLDEVWSHVENQQDDHVRLIGLYGMGGVGKTTLLKAVNNKLCSSTLNFGPQFWIVVSKTPNLIDIQNHIGKKIGFHGYDWEVKSQDEKATEIYNVLCQKKYILLLDDIWERFDLTKIGIPLPNLQNQSMVIFTTRSLQVCGQMKATKIQVRCLNEVEAWNLFKENVGEKTLNAHHNIPGLAKDVMRECSGLPLALIVIGRAMTCSETIHDWERAIEVLKSYAADFSSTITDEVFTPLKYSFDNLTNDAIRSCLLYCSLYAEDQEILKSDLVDKWICEDFLGGSEVLHNARNKGRHYISNLLHASLLEECSLETVKMHDVIRDMALWIVGDGFYVKAQAGLTQIPKDVKWKHVEKMSLMNNSIKELNDGPTEVTKIQTILFLRVKLSSINNDFLKFVPNLKVLDLSFNMSLWSLPEELSELVSLHYLNLSHTSLKELPNDFQKLAKLKYLNVEYTKIYTIPKGVLSSMKELSIFICGNDPNITCYDFLGENLVEEFEGLKNLQEVVIPATYTVEISNLLSSINLLNCITQFTITSICDSTSLDILFLKEMKHLQILSIRKLERVKRIVVGEGQGLKASTTNNRNGFNNLRSLHVYGCPRLKNLSWLVFLPNIENLSVSRCDEMETLVSENEYKVDNEVERFAKLQTVELKWMPKLKSIYFTSLPFSCLNKLSIYASLNLEKLPFNSGSCDRRGITIKGEDYWWDELYWEDKVTRDTFSSCFHSLPGP